MLARLVESLALRGRVGPVSASLLILLHLLQVLLRNVVLIPGVSSSVVATVGRVCLLLVLVPCGL